MLTSSKIITGDLNRVNSAQEYVSCAYLWQLRLEGVPGEERVDLVDQELLDVLPEELLDDLLLLLVAAAQVQALIVQVHSPKG